MTPQLEGPINDVRLEPGNPAVGIILIEDVFVDAADALHGRGIGIDGNRHLLAKVKHPHVIQSEDVVGVGVGKDDRVQPAHTFTQGLLAEVGGGIDDHHPAVKLQHDGGSGSLVVGVRGLADRAIAGEGRNAG